MDGLSHAALEKIAEIATRIARLASSAAALEGHSSQQAVVAELVQQYDALASQFRSENIATQISTGAITDSAGVAIGPDAHSTVETINTGGGDFAEGQIDKRQGAFVSGGEVTGPVVGMNSGTISTRSNPQ